jgi:hypothetical protein
MANNFAATISAAFRHAEGTSFDPPASTHSLAIELDAEHFAALEAHAVACGINPSVLVALWIEPHLHGLRRQRPLS